MSPDAAPGAAGRRPPAPGERELKFTLPAGRMAVGRRWLEQLCRRDPAFPAAIVWTIYYDSPGLASLSEKINSDFLKRKIRLRWYSSLDGQAQGPAFVEAKFRTGTRRAKVREQVPHGADELSRWALHDPRLVSLPMLLQRHGVLGHESWQPMMLIRYRRDRFVEPVTRARVSLDAEIAAAAINPRFVSGADLSPIDRAVLEIKGMEEQLPLGLRPLLALGLRRQSYSKFLVAYAHATRESL